MNTNCEIKKKIKREMEGISTAALVLGAVTAVLTYFLLA